MPITFEELIAASLLKFNGEIDTLDISLLISNINEPYNFSNKSNNRINYLTKFQNNKYQLKEGLTLETLLKPDLTIQSILENIAKPNALTFLNNLDLTNFVLQKINHLGGISENSLNTKLNKVELNECLRLIKEGYLYTIWTKESIYDDSQSIVLSKKGEVYLFIKTYSHQVELFKYELLSHGYNPDLIGVYLITKNLHRPIDEIFNISDFEYFGHIFDVDLTKNDDLTL